MPGTFRIDSSSALLALIVVAGGCGGEDRLSRVVVAGTVNYDGKPVQKGQIRFLPQPGTSGPVTIDPIEGGSYSTKNTSGVPVGSHRVEITGYDPVEYANAPTGPGSPPVRQRLPEKYNRKSELAVTLDADSDGKPLDFNLAR
jgi:hypothetical protein